MTSKPKTQKRTVAKVGGVGLSIQDLLLLGMRLHREDRFDEAEKCYRAVLQAEPRTANAMHFLGVLLHHIGRQPVQALQLIRASIKLDPTVAPWHNNLGNVLLGQEFYDDAAAAYARCSELDPDNLEVLNNLGVLLRRLQRPQEAEQALKRAVALEPSFAHAHANLATLYSFQEREDEAFLHFAKAAALKPNDHLASQMLVRAYGKAGRFEDGRNFLREWLEREPDNPQARHFLAAYGGADVPERASDQYIEDEFDAFAKSFDAKLASLDYRAPQFVGEAVARLLGPGQRRWRIVDVGCGTGLCGPYLRPYALDLAGVDLSANMLELAHARGLYDSLVKSELVAWLEHCAQPQDLVVSADTMTYFGRLGPVFAAARRALVADGHLIFTVESHAGQAEFTLQAHGRYSHARGSIRAELERAGFGAIDIREVALRSESGLPVAGSLVCARAHGMVDEILQDAVKEPGHAT